MSNDKAMIDAIRLALSPTRMVTYEKAAAVKNPDDLSALELYRWNAEVSGALLTPLHICEVVVRNSVSDAVSSVYGPNWHLSNSFELSLPNPKYGYNPREDLKKNKNKSKNLGQIISNLSFVFWQNMFTSRHDNRIWNNYIFNVMPNLDKKGKISDLRLSIFNDLETIRKLRNRIAHHEPIFTRNLQEDYDKIVKIINFRCTLTASWLVNNQTATDVIAKKP